MSCASNNEPVEQQIIFEEHDSNNGLNGADISQNQWNGSTIVIDNFINFFPRIDFQTSSLHICNAYAV